MHVYLYPRGSKRSHTGGKCVTYSGLTNSRWTLNALQSILFSSLNIWEKRRRRKVCMHVYFNLRNIFGVGKTFPDTHE